MSEEGPGILTTALDHPFPKAWISRLKSSSKFVRPRRFAHGQRDLHESNQDVSVDPELKLPKLASLIIVLLTSGLLQISFFIIVSSSNLYAEHLGGTATFAGLVIGIPTVFSGLTLIPLLRLDQGKYTRPLHFACGSALLGHILYGLAYKANFLYLILISRIVSGFGFTYWMYAKRYCSDHRVVGVRRRTMLAGWLVVGQATGFSLGPFLGGVLYKVGFSNDVFNGYTSPSWLMAGVWAVFWIFAATFFEDVPSEPQASQDMELSPITATPIVGSPAGAETASKMDDATLEPEVRVVERESSSPESQPSSFMHSRVMSGAQWGVTATMCWFSMTCFFVLGAWEANIPVFTGSNSPLSPFHFSPFAAGNLIALGGACTFPFLFVNVFVARRYQDRNTLALGTSLGIAGLFIALAILSTKTVDYASLFICWFLIALGFNLASTVTLSLLSKQLPNHWNSKISLAIQYSNYTGRVTGAVLGGAGVKLGMKNYVGIQIAVVGVGVVMFMSLWKSLKAKTG